MCDFCSIIGVAIGDRYEILHTPDNSHTGMSGELKNLPNRKPILFEAEWDGEGELPSDEKLIRNSSECPEPLKDKIREFYQNLKEAVQDGKHFGKGGYFSDHNKYHDVWTRAMRNGHPPDFSEVTEFAGSVDVYEGATFTAHQLTSVAGSVVVREGTTFDAPQLTTAGSVYVYEGATFTAPQLTTAGSVVVREGTTFDAPQLTTAGSVVVLEGATFDAPQLTSVAGSVVVREGATFKSPKLKSNYANSY